MYFYIPGKNDFNPKNSKILNYNSPHYEQFRSFLSLKKPIPTYLSNHSLFINYSLHNIILLPCLDDRLWAHQHPTTSTPPILLHTITHHHSPAFTTLTLEYFKFKCRLHSCTKPNHFCDHPLVVGLLLREERGRKKAVKKKDKKYFADL